ncbi:Mannonate dehydratase [Pseudonocardia sp. Ae717_Ps2]|uniref:mannonate dehydratase n=1 Tax=Pseudonocardia sp. Ae717_Ps2 TaxID=1885573 RepID=UPI00094B0D7F|nr:mannonate dehydratase [Pseudonocardia sp. Ae717_Ps2]OLM28564.1 Mannonate dehydratase [Pseudonocardia sp. Ae717_Ps2]
MKHSWRWFGPSDPVTLAEIRQTGATDIVSALHHLPNGEVWPVEEIAARRSEIEAAGLTWSVVESVPIHEEIKRGGPLRDKYIDAYTQTLRNLAECHLQVVCYNFLPILDWVRTDLGFELTDGSWALRYTHAEFVAFDIFILQRPDAEKDYAADDVASAREFFANADEGRVAELERTILGGLPGSEETYSLESLRDTIETYKGIDDSIYRQNLSYFLHRVVPVAEQVDIRLGMHADDPPWPLLGLPRIVSSRDDIAWLLAEVPSPANGLTFCAGSIGERLDNDVVAMAREFADRVHFAHLRSTSRWEGSGPYDFYEADHISGGTDIVGVVRELVAEEYQRESRGGSEIFVRPDHGHQILDDKGRVTRPGYPLIGRLKGLSELRGVEAGVRAMLGTRSDESSRAASA